MVSVLHWVNNLLDGTVPKVLDLYPANRDLKLVAGYFAYHLQHPLAGIENALYFIHPSKLGRGKFSCTQGLRINFSLAPLKFIPSA
jgi:hypothetical protein